MAEGLVKVVNKAPHATQRRLDMTHIYAIVT